MAQYGVAAAWMGETREPAAECWVAARAEDLMDAVAECSSGAERAEGWPGAREAACSLV